MFQTNQIGSDGFNWWIGQIESNKGDDPKKSGRYRVRIVGQHLKSGDAVPSSELPWAQVMMPVTTPFSDGGVTGATANLNLGNWVIGFHLDNDKQKPMIMGSIGHTAGATVIQNQDPNPGGNNKSFTTYTDPNLNPSANRSVDSSDGKDPKTGANTDGGEPAAARSNEPGGAPAIIAALKSQWSEANPIGSKSCVVIANPKCGNESNLKNNVKNIISDMLAANQASGGQLGDFYVSKINGFLYDKINVVRYHIGRITRLVRSLLARAQSEIIKLIRKGIETLVNKLLLVDDPQGKIIGNTGPLKDPEKAFKPIRQKGNRFKKIKKILDKILQQLDCAIEDATDRISKWLTDLLFNYIMQVFNAATCFINQLVEGIINQILSIIEQLLDSVLGPLQLILSAIASPINIVGKALNSIMSFLGINCSGPKGNCSKITKKCTDCSKDKKDGLDDLLKKIEDGIGETSSGVCEESQDYPVQSKTEVIFIGGVPSAPTPSNANTPPGSLDVDVPTPDSFFPSPAEDPSDDPTIMPPSDIDKDNTNFDPDPYLPTDPGDGPDGEFDLPLDPDGTPYYSVVADKNLVEEGETITYTIRTVNVNIGTTLNYTLSGPTIAKEYFVTKSLKGSFVLNNLDVVTIDSVDADGNLIEVQIQRCTATVQITIASDGVYTENTQLLTFSIDNTDASTNVNINSEINVIPRVDNDLDPDPTYSVTTEKTNYIEGEDISFVIITSNVDDGTILDYIIYGDVAANDFVSGTLTGKVEIQDNIGIATVGILEDLAIEEKERATFQLITTTAEATVYIVPVDAEGNPKVPDEGDNEDEDTMTTPDPEIEPPIAGEPITDDDGAIISIPVVDKGDKYNEAPFVIVSGSGYGATAIALLDTAGYVSEVRVTRPGLGYNVNTSENSNLSCIIDSFTLISPGIKYTESPKVYINGDSTVARAQIDSRGYVIGVEILDRTIKFKKFPDIKIIGGGGAGAVVLPNLVCLGVEELERRGYAKIGTGKYIDCP